MSQVRKPRPIGGWYQVQVFQGEATIVKFTERLPCGLSFREARRQALNFYMTKPMLTEEDRAAIEALKKMRARDVDVTVLKG